MRSPLRIADLKRGTNGGGTKGEGATLSVTSVPFRIVEAIEQLGKKLGASRKDVLLALLNEGLDVAGKKRGKQRRT